MSWWQATQPDTLILNTVARPAGTWHFAQATSACFARKGNAVALWSATEYFAGLKPSTEWHDSQRPPSARARNCPLWGSGLWQSEQRLWAMGALKSPPR